MEEKESGMQRGQNIPRRNSISKGSQVGKSLLLSGIKRSVRLENEAERSVRC